MKRYLIICTLIVCSACNQDNGRQNKADGRLIATAASEQETAEATVIGFLKWYKNNNGRLDTIDLIHNDGDTIHDPAKFYTVNFENTEKYLGELKSSGFISENYIETWRQYFKSCDINLHKTHQDDGPAEGFEFDFVMWSQDYEDDLKNIDKVKTKASLSKDGKWLVTVEFSSGSVLIYTLTKPGGKFLIDTIQNAS